MTFWQKIADFFKNLFTTNEAPPPSSGVPESGSFAGGGGSGAGQVAHEIVPTTKGQLWIPFATNIVTKYGLIIPSKGLISGGYPQLIVIHATAGHNTQGSMLNEMKNAIKGGVLGYLGIEPNGEILQGHTLNRWTNHCGESEHPLFPGLKSLNAVSQGIEVACGGKLDPDLKAGGFKTWFGKAVDSKNYRTILAWPFTADGTYEKFTPEQEASLIRLLKFLVANDPTGRLTYDHIVAHHEISGPRWWSAGLFKKYRKTDPGGSLSMPMDDLRAKLKSGAL